MPVHTSFQSVLYTLPGPTDSSSHRSHFSSLHLPSTDCTDVVLLEHRTQSRTAVDVRERDREWGQPGCTCGQSTTVVYSIVCGYGRSCYDRPSLRIYRVTRRLLKLKLGRGVELDLLDLGATCGLTDTMTFYDSLRKSTSTSVKGHQSRRVSDSGPVGLRQSTRPCSHTSAPAAPADPPPG